jgi:hypothetical protein
MPERKQPTPKGRKWKYCEAAFNYLTHSGKLFVFEGAGTVEATRAASHVSPSELVEKHACATFGGANGGVR